MGVNRLPPRNAVRLLVDPLFGVYFFGKVLATSGMWIHNIVAAILVFALSGSAFMVGLVTVAQFGPQLLLAPLSGAMADRGDRKHQLIAGRLVVAAGSGGLAIWLWLVGVQGLPSAWTVVAAAFVVGLGSVIAGPAQNALIPALVRESELPAAVALNAVPATIARALGPAVGAAVALGVGPAAAFALAAGGTLVFALMMLPLELQSRAVAGRHSDNRVRAAFRYLRKDRGISPILVGIVGIGFGVDPIVTLSPALSADLGAGRELVGPLASAFGIGAGLAFGFLSPLRKRLGLPSLSTTGLALIATGLGGSSVNLSPELALVLFAIAGAGMTMALTSLSTLLQQRLPDELRGRMMALWSVAFLGSRPIAAALGGAVADVRSTRAALVLIAMVVSAAAWVCRPSKFDDFALERAAGPQC